MISLIFPSATVPGSLEIARVSKRRAEEELRVQTQWHLSATVSRRALQGCCVMCKRVGQVSMLDVSKQHFGEGEVREKEKKGVGL